MRKPRANKTQKPLAPEHVPPIVHPGVDYHPQEPCVVLDQRPRVHVLGLPHTIVSEAFSHCAFTGKVLRMPSVLPDYRVIEYSNGCSSSKAAEHVQVFSQQQLESYGGGSLESLQACCTVTLASDGDLQQAWLALTIRELRKRARAGDVIAITYPFENYHKLVQAFPECVVVETGIGYSWAPFGAYRVFESETWRAWHFGKWCGENGALGDFPTYTPANCSAVVPNYYDVEQWPLGLGQGWDWLAERPSVPGAASTPYVFFAGRMASAKGIEIVNALAERFDELTFVVASGEAFLPDRFPAKNVQFIGRVDSRAEMADWMGGALCTLVPSRFHEPFGGVAVESLLCGTPVLCSDWAAFTETVQSGYDDGLRCNDLHEFVSALAHVQANAEDWNIGRERRQARARERFGLEPVSLKYKAAIEMFRRMHADGLKP
jgi:glycosyltransferase involved in cell wall biosynthesis